MKNRKKTVLNLLNVFLLLVPIFILAQETEKPFKPTFKWNATAQIWLRYSDLNQGSLVNGEPTSSFTDVSIRRIRIPISAQVTPRIFAYAIFGGNNYNLKSMQNPIEVLDFYMEYAFSKHLEIGLGKSGWQGLSRWNVRSSSTLMGLDSPLFSLNTVEKNDDLGRQFGLWLKGQAGHFDYRLTFNQPRIITKAPANGVVDFANNRPRWKTSSYINYQFFENESNKSAYQTGTYLANKKVFNIGAGFQYQENAFSDGDFNNPNTTFYDMKHWAIDSYLNLPFANEDAITAYLGYYSFDFGKDYIRNVGANNPTNGVTDPDFNGAGVAFPMMGTGPTWYTQFGYAFRKTKLINHQVVIQPNIAIQHSNYDALEDSMTVYDFTVNFLVNGKHGNKISLGYQLRPIFDADTLLEKDRKGMAVLQYQISFK
ncbi:porin [Tamlana fucoidanivorans]|uniref:Porin n=1 Tax=Allotamlana fucoidanivorans TaxID=2583814 RepID=A0A5C4SQE0_9FLAO|nr:porin [Tamlana fucoidanivorans]TNJ46146.1 porin [Tamlana fucoidanivorans]